jgi:hypothetical protein
MKASESSLDFWDNEIDAKIWDNIWTSLTKGKRVLIHYIMELGIFCFAQSAGNNLLYN